MDETGLENSAILLMSLGEEDAAQVLKHLTPKEVQGVGETIARRRHPARTPRDRAGSLSFGEEHSQKWSPTPTIRPSFLARHSARTRPTCLLDRICKADVSGIESSSGWTRPPSPSCCVRASQIVAAILVHLDFDQASAVLKLFTERHRNGGRVAHRHARRIPPSALKDLNEVGDLADRRRLGASQPSAARAGGGRDAEPDGQQRSNLGARIERETDSELAQKINGNMFTFDDLIKVDDKAIQA